MSRSTYLLLRVTDDGPTGWTAQAMALGSEQAPPPPFEQPDALVAWLAQLAQRPNGAPASEPRLTSRENEVALLFAAGSNHKRIAARLQLAPATVRNHLSACYRKLGVGSRAALLAALASSPERGVTVEHLLHADDSVTDAH